MDKKNILTYFTIAGLSIVFVIVSVLLFVNRGKNAKLLKKKLKLGAMIISLTAVVSASYVSCCYAPPTQQINMERTYFHTNAFFIDRSFTEEIYGTQEYLSGYHEYSISNDEVPAYQSGYLEPVDGSLDSDYEEVVLEIKDILPNGDYFLDIEYLWGYDNDTVYVVLTEERDIIFINYYGEENSIEIGYYDEQGLNVNIALSDSSEYSYRIVDIDSQVVQEGNITVENYDYESSDMMKKGNIETYSLVSGEYTIDFYNVPLSEQDINSPIKSYSLTIQ